jgi:adenosylcobinamide-GDP ribazoletransferase
MGLAGSFLTVLPFPSGPFDRKALAAGVALFPVVGIVLGGALGALGLALDLALPPGVTAVVLLAAGALVTGGLHLDGLMDTADGVFGGATSERRLEIMRDSRVGSFGVLAGTLVLLGQYACLSELTGTRRLVALVVALGLSRWAMALALGSFPSARPTGLGATFRTDAGRRPVVAATVVALGLAAMTGVLGIAGLLATAAVVMAGGRFFMARLGGLTGDNYGALAVTSETLILLVAIALRPGG